jgi:hypothetical protein
MDPLRFGVPGQPIGAIGLRGAGLRAVESGVRNLTSPRKLLVKRLSYPELVDVPRNGRTMLDTQKRLLEYAVQRIGRAGLAALLRVPLAILDDWLMSLTPMPIPKFIALVEYVLDDFDSNVH